MDKVHKHDSSKCNTPLSEPFRTDMLIFYHFKINETEVWNFQVETTLVPINVGSSAATDMKHLQG
jgi:hypothetical protein